MSDQAFGANCQAQSNASLDLMAVIYDPRNRITSASASTGYVYDDAGNVINDGRYEYRYDGEGRMCASKLTAGSDITGYLYNAEGQRVAKGTLGSWTCDPTSLQITNEYILGLNGEQVTELDGNGNLIRTNVHADGKLIATYDSNGALHYRFDDWLGTRRLQTSAAGVVEQTCSGGAFGDQLNCSDNESSGLHFTRKERDAESGLDYFGARYYASSMGRMMSPDPSGLALADITNPQSLNLYSYVLNNPLRNVDPDGLECIWDDGSFDSADDKQTGSHAGCSAAGGTYADPTAFGKLNAGDWSNQANSDIAAIGNALNQSNNFTDVTVNANGSGYIDQTGITLSGGSPYIVKNDYSWSGDRSLALATGVMSQGIPKVCAIGVTATLRKNSVGAASLGAGSEEL